MKGYLINPFDQTIKPVTLQKDNTLGQIYVLCQCERIDGVYSIDGHTIFVDDEGLFVENQRYFKYNGQSLAGRALVLRATEEGDSSDAEEWVLEHLQQHVEWKPKGFSLQPRMDFIAWE